MAMPSFEKGDVVIDPISITAAVGGATAAFNTIKSMIAAGRDMESCIGDVSQVIPTVTHGIAEYLQ